MAVLPWGMRIFIQMDRPQRFNPKRDSTMALAVEAQKRGYEVHSFTPDELSLKNGEVVARARPVTFYERTEHFVEEGEATIRPLETAADIVLIRQEPPYDLQYLTTSWLLERLKKPRVLNNPTSLRNRPEKLFPLALPQYAPPTLISRDVAAIKAFRQEHKEIILKPLYQFGGASVFHVDERDYNLDSLLEMMLKQSREPVIVQPFLPEVKEREIRGLLVNGKLVGAYNRIPPSGGIRANSVVGGDIAVAELSAKQREVCEAVGEICRAEGFFFVGLDLIGEVLIEVNTTCPTGLKAYEELTGHNPSVDFWDEIEATAA